MMNEALVAAYMACASYSSYGMGNEAGVTYVYQGANKEACDKIQTAYKQMMDVEGAALRAAKDAANSKVISDGLASIGQK